MLQTCELFVFSDIHLSAQRGRGLFRSDLALSKCLKWIAEEKPNSCVAINGDFLDFLVLGETEGPGNFYEVEKFLPRTQEIIDMHPEVFDALACLADSLRTPLVIITGNHDPELVFPEVQRIIEARLATNSMKWIVHGEGAQVGIGEVTAFLEHGNRFDRYNRIDHNGLRELLCLKTRGFSVDAGYFYTPPFGSKVVLDYLAAIRSQFPWVDYIAPGTEAAFILMRELTTLKQKTSFIRAIQDALWLFRDDEFARHSRIGVSDEVFRTDDGGIFEEWLHDNLGDNSEERRGWILKDSDDDLIKELVAETAAATVITEEEQLDRELRNLYQRAQIVVTGHSHKAMICNGGSGLYINTGTWGQILELPNREAEPTVWKSFLTNLRRGSDWQDDSFCKPTFANVCLDGDGVTSGALMRWNETVPQDLSRSYWDRAHRRWSEEAPKQ